MGGIPTLSSPLHQGLGLEGPWRSYETEAAKQLPQVCTCLAQVPASLLRTLARCSLSTSGLGAWLLDQLQETTYLCPFTLVQAATQPSWSCLLSPPGPSLWPLPRVTPHVKGTPTEQTGYGSGSGPLQ